MDMHFVWRWGWIWLCLQTRIAFAEPPQVVSADTLSKIVEQVEPSVVSVLRIRLNPKEHRDDSSQIKPGHDYLPNDYGAGVLVQSPGNPQLFVLTAYHLVRGSRVAGKKHDENQAELQLRFQNRRACSAAIFAADPRSDLAVLTFDPVELGGQPSELRPLDWQHSLPVKKGQFVVCLGNPYALARDGSASVTWGVISNLARKPVFANNTEFPSRDQAQQMLLQNLGTMLQIDARLQLGGSGGPVVNLDGQLVGISTALAAIEGYEKSAGFAIPVAPPLRRIVETLLLGQEVEYGLLGISPGTVSSDEMRKLGIYDLQPTAALVESVPDGSPAEIAGLTSSDILLKIDNQPVYSSSDLMRLVGEYPPEAEVSLQVFRPKGKDRKVLTLRSKLAKWPVKDDQGIIATKPKYPAWRGLRVDYPTAREKYVQYSEWFVPGVIVIDVEADSWASRAKLQQGDIIKQVDQTPVQTPEQFQRAVKKLTGNVTLQLYVSRNDPPKSVIISE